MKRHTKHTRPGFTLSEMTVSSFIMGLVVVGIASSIMVATEALPDSEDPAQAAVIGAAVSNQIVEELRYATAITERSSTTIAFAVNDRDDDGVSERIRYAWSGTAGDALFREYNGGEPVAIAQNVSEFSLSYHLDAVDEEYPGPIAESQTGMLFNLSGSGSMNVEDIRQDKWMGQYFKPSLPTGALSWKVTLVQLRMRQKGPATGQTRVQLRTVDSDNTPDQLLEEVVIQETELALESKQPKWEDFFFNSVGDLSPEQGVCVAVITNDDDVSAQLEFHNGSVVMPNAGLLESRNGENDWSLDTDKGLKIKVNGTYVAPMPPQTARRRYLTAVRTAIQVGEDTDARTISATPALNRPELLEAFWEVDFDDDPTMDHNADNQTDWAVRGGGTFARSSLDSGVWTASSTLDTRPDNDFSNLTTVNVRFRNTSQGGQGAVFRINADWSGSMCAPILAHVRLMPDDTQTLRVSHYEGGTATPLVEVAGLPPSFVGLRLLIDPALDTVNVRVHDLDFGTYLYNSVTPPNSDRFATVMSSGSNAEFDLVSIRVSDNGE